MSTNLKKLFAAFLIFFATYCVFARAGYAYMLRDDGSLRVDNGNGGAVWATEVPAGTELRLVSDSIVKKDLVTSDKTIKNCDFYEVEYEGKKYFAYAVEVAVGGSISVITENATLFSKPTPSSFRNAFFECGEIVVSYENTRYVGLDFVEIKFWDSNEWHVKSRFVQARKVSNNTDDVEAVQIVTKALATKDEDLRKALITRATEKNTTVPIRRFTQEAYNTIFGLRKFVEEDIVSVEPFSATIDTKGNGDHVVVRSWPGTDSETVGRLQHGDMIDVSLETSETEKIDNITARWYFVNARSESLSGWVFGAYVNDK